MQMDLSQSKSAPAFLGSLQSAQLVEGQTARLEVGARGTGNGDPWVPENRVSMIKNPGTISQEMRTRDRDPGTRGQ